MIKEVKQSFVKIYNFIQRPFAYNTQLEHVSKYIRYGPGDNYPQQLIELVKDSPTATSCLSTQADFITGEGFNLGEDLENMVINSQGEKFFTYHTIQSDFFTKHWGVATLVKYNKAGGITEFYDIPFGYCRLGKPDDNGIISKILYNPYFGTTEYREKDNESYDVFNPAAAIIQATDPKWKGQIYWMGVRDSKNPFYPEPDYMSAKRWMRVEKNGAVYFDENLENGFLTPTLLKLIGDPNDPSGMKDDDGNDIPKSKAIDKELTQNFSGASRVGQIMTFWGSNKEEWPEAESWPTNANAEIHRVIDDQATKKITIATKVPAILANISEGVSLGGDGNTIRAAVKLMQQRVKRPQSILIDYYMPILKLFVNYKQTEPITLVPYNPFPELEAIDGQVWTELTAEERRKWINDHTEIELIEETAPAVTDPSVTEAHHTKTKFVNQYYNSYPRKARENVKRALDWAEKFNSDCLKPGGKKTSQKILDGVPLSQPEIKRLSRFLSGKTIYKNNPYADSCEALMYDAWGGSDMMVWANEKMNEFQGKSDEYIGY